MSCEDSYDLSWFFDSEQSKIPSDNDFSAAEITRRPWKAFWPPRSKDHLNVWLGSEFPEVLSWHFDPNQPFDQPWRNWLRSLLMKDELGSCRKKYTLKLEHQAQLVRPDPASTLTTDTEDQFMRLPKVQVDTISYLAPLEVYNTEKPYFSQLPCGTKLPRTNLIESEHRVEVRDVSGREELFQLDETGFQFLHLPSRISEWTDESVQSEYLPEISMWLKEYFQCEKVFIYNYNLRTNDTKAAGNGVWRAPIFRAHCDNTAASCAKRLEFQFPTEAKTISEGRYRYIDIWRNVAGEDADSPLAVCDYRSVETADLKRIDIVYPHFSEEGFELIYNPAHRWFYRRGMSKDDVVLFKLDDNLPTVTPFAPHSAFIDPSVSGSCKRASIEVRAILLG